MIVQTARNYLQSLEPEQTDGMLGAASCKLHAITLSLETLPAARASTEA